MSVPITYVTGVIPCVDNSEATVEMWLPVLVVDEDTNICLGAFRNEDEADGYREALLSGEIECPDWDPENPNLGLRWVKDQ